MVLEVETCTDSNPSEERRVSDEDLDVVLNECPILMPVMLSSNFAWLEAPARWTPVWHMKEKEYLHTIFRK